MTTDILTYIQNKMDSFSKGQKRIASYILNNYDQAAFQTANVLGKTVDVSESTVVRFATLLGYSGYPEMQKCLQEVVLNRLTAPQRIEMVEHRMDREKVLETVLQADMERIRATAEEIDAAAFEAAIDLLLSAGRIFVVGVRAAAPVASFLGFYLRYLAEDVRVLTGDSVIEMLEQVTRIRPQDVLIGISFPRYCTVTRRAMELAKSVGCGTIALTDRRDSPIALRADAVLTAKSGMASLVDSMVAPMSVVNALLAAVASRSKPETEQTLEKLEEFWVDYHVYEKTDE